MAFSLGIVTNLKIWYNTRMKSKQHIYSKVLNDGSRIQIPESKKGEIV